MEELGLGNRENPAGVGVDILVSVGVSAPNSGLKTARTGGVDGELECFVGKIQSIYDVAREGGINYKSLGRKA